MMAHDAELITAMAAAVAGDQSAFAALVDQLSPRLERWLSAGGVGYHDAQEIIQDGFVRAWLSRHRYRVGQPVEPWIFTITHRVRIDRLRLAQPTQGLEALAGHAGSDADELPDGAGLWTMARAQLDARSFQVVWLHIAEDLDHAEIAQVMEITVGNARVILHRALAHLRESLSPRASMSSTIIGAY